ncbi:hypothetical protein FRC00_007649, partial [Tulasnella sp. 408]
GQNILQFSVSSQPDHFATQQHRFSLLVRSLTTNMQNNAPAKGGANPQPTILQQQWVPMGLYVIINKGPNMLLDLRGGEYEGDCAHTP